MRWALQFSHTALYTALRSQVEQEVGVGSVPEWMMRARYLAAAWGDSWLASTPRLVTASALSSSMRGFEFYEQAASFLSLSFCGLHSTFLVLAARAHLAQTNLGSTIKRARSSGRAAIPLGPQSHSVFVDIQSSLRCPSLCARGSFYGERPPK